jgi:hypothetical protein
MPRLLGFSGLLPAGSARRREARRGPCRITRGSLAFLAADGLVGAASTGSLLAPWVSLYAHLVPPVALRDGPPPKPPIPRTGATATPVSLAVRPPGPAPLAQPAIARVPPRPAAAPTLFADCIGRAVGRGDALVRGGEVEAARFFFQLAADAGDRQAALRLGETFDPAFVRYRLGRCDWRAARYWYQRALALGDADAASRIARLDAQPAR